MRATRTHSQGRLRPPTVASILGNTAVSSVAAWSIPCVYRRRGKPVVDIHDNIAYIVPFRENDLLEEFGDDIDAHSAAQRAARGMRAKRDRLRACEREARRQLAAYTDVSHATACWIVTSRFGDRLVGNHADLQSTDDAKKATRLQQTEDLMETDAEWLAVRMAFPSLGCYQAHPSRTSIDGVDGERLSLVRVRFVGPVMALTPPGAHNVVVAIGIAKEV